MKTNVKNKNTAKTHEGAVAYPSNARTELRRAVMCCLLWEDLFYESGESVVERIKSLVPKVPAEEVAAMAIEAREVFNLRHVPLLMVREMARLESHRHLVEKTLATVIQRPDELTEFLSLYWLDGKCPVAGQVKRGLATAFKKFNEYQLAKYDQNGAVKLRDVLFMTHPYPYNEEQEKLFKAVADKTLQTPDTWEVNLSAGGDKKEIWTRLLSEKKLGALAFLRNLRNMREAGVDRSLVRGYLSDLDVSRVIPYRFIAAARYAPELEDVLEDCMFRSISSLPKLTGHTVMLVDVSGSMSSMLSGKSEMSYLDAACGLAMILREVCEDLTVYSFSRDTVSVPNRRGFALRDAIVKSQPHGSTYLGQAVREVNSTVSSEGRMIVLTDEQSHDTVGKSVCDKAYMIDVAAYKNGVGFGDWNRINGWSEGIVRYIQSLENQD
jgi:hypothetical protein